jgi:hypothetical protein
MRPRAAKGPTVSKQRSGARPRVLDGGPLAPDDLINPAFAAALLGYTPQAIFDAIDCGELRARRVRGGTNGKPSWVTTVVDLRRFRDRRIAQYEPQTSKYHRDRLKTLRGSVGRLCEDAS